MDAPSLKYRTFAVDDNGGVQNRKLDPGESAKLLFVLHNAGGPAPAVDAVLRSRSPYLTVIDSVGSFPACGQGETTVSAVDGFVVQAQHGAPIEAPQYCSLLLSGAGYADTLRVPVIVGDSMNLPAGPDAGGYCIFDWTDSCYQQRPDYDWLELSGIGTALSLGDDETRTLPLPRDFGPWRYYGILYDSISVCANGWVAAGATERCDFVNVELPSPGAPPNIVAFLWDDLAPSMGGHVWFLHDTARHRFVVEFDSIRYFGRPGKWEEVQFQLYDTTVRSRTGDNVMTVQFRTVNDYTSATVGFQNRDGTAGLTHAWNDHLPRVSCPLQPLRALQFQTVAQSGTREARGSAGRRFIRAMPNPFSSATLFDVCPREASCIVIYDVAGRVVRVLVAGPGCGKVRWDGRTADGRRVLPGTYFAVAGDRRTAVAKLVLTGE